MVGQFVLMMKNKAIYLQVKKTFLINEEEAESRKNQMNCKMFKS